MGYYINQLPDGTVLPAKGKAKLLLTIPGAKRFAMGPLLGEKYQEDLVCVVHNGPFEAAAYAFSENEFRVFASEQRRLTEWLIVPNAKDLAE